MIEVLHQPDQISLNTMLDKRTFKRPVVSSKRSKKSSLSSNERKSERAHLGKRPFSRLDTQNKVVLEHSDREDSSERNSQNN
jgi:hypothetical protein